jgi:hypothetical protein
VEIVHPNAAEVVLGEETELVLVVLIKALAEAQVVLVDLLMVDAAAGRVVQEIDRLNLGLSILQRVILLGQQVIK